MLAESLPNITGHIYATLTPIANKDTNAGGFFKYDTFYDSAVQLNDSSVEKCYSVSGNASRSSSTYQDNAPVQQNALVCCFCIKY